MGGLWLISIPVLVMWGIWVIGFFYVFANAVGEIANRLDRIIHLLETGRGPN
jgi:hypothetical protein